MSTTRSEMSKSIAPSKQTKIGKPIMRTNQIRPYEGDSCSCGGTLKFFEGHQYYGGLYYLSCKCGYRSQYYRMKYFTYNGDEI